MAHNQRNRDDRSQQNNQRGQDQWQNNPRSEQNDESLNTSSTQGGTERRETKQHSGQDLDAGRGGHQNALANRSGTTDMDDDAIAGTGRGNTTERGSGMTTKRNVTGSDYDGQISR